MLAPICLFTYNRLSETKQTIEALQQNYLASLSDLFIFSDGPKNVLSVPKVDEVRKYLRSLKGFRSVTMIESTQNKGLADSIIFGVTEIIERFGKVIVLEDDLITCPNFLNFMNQALDYYEHDLKIQSVNGFSLYLKKVDPTFDVYFQTRPFSWGWGTWQNRWDQRIFNKQTLKAEVTSDNSVIKRLKRRCGDDMPKMFLDSILNKNDSWYVRWAYDHLKKDRLSVYPASSLVTNIGFGESGTHCRGINSFNSKMGEPDKTKFNFIQVNTPNADLTTEFLNYFSFRHKLATRFKLLGSKNGREQIRSEIKMKFQL